MVSILHGAVKPDPAALEFSQRVLGLSALAAVIKARLKPNPPDIETILAEIGGILDQSIAGTAIRDDGPAPIDLSRIDFEALSKRLKESKRKQIDLEMLKAAIRARLMGLIRLNPTRADFLEKFEDLIEEYNSGSRNIEATLAELLNLTRSLGEEEQRHVRENLSEEELVIFDILTRPAPELSAEERVEVKKIAKELLGRLKDGLLVLNWRAKPSARSRVRMAIDDGLDTGLPRAYTPELFAQKCAAVFEHVYEAYPDRP